MLRIAIVSLASMLVAAPTTAASETEPWGNYGGWLVHLTDQTYNDPAIAVGLRIAPMYFRSAGACPGGVTVRGFRVVDDPASEGPPSALVPLELAALSSCTIGIGPGFHNSDLPPAARCGIVVHGYGHAALGLSDRAKGYAGDAIDPIGVMGGLAAPQCVAAYDRSDPRGPWRKISREERVNSWCRWHTERCVEHRPALAALALGPRNDKRPATPREGDGA